MGTLTGALSLALLAHCDEDLENFLDRYWIYLELYGPFKNAGKDFICPLVVADRNACGYLDPGDFDSEFLAAGNKPEDFRIHICYISPDSIEGHTNKLPTGVQINVILSLTGLS